MSECSGLHVTLLTGRTIEQGVGKEHSKPSEEYQQSASVCFIDPSDLKLLKIKDGTNVRVSTGSGQVILKSVKSPRAPHCGTIFIPYGPWANAIVFPTTESIGMPSLKGIPAVVEPAPTEQVLRLRELLKKHFGDK